MPAADDRIAVVISAPCSATGPPSAKALAVDRDSIGQNQPSPASVGRELRAAPAAERDPRRFAGKVMPTWRWPWRPPTDRLWTSLAAIADGLRRDTWSAIGSPYVVNRNINFTNVCYTGCRFCAFAQRESDADAFTLGLDDIGSRVDEAVAAGATEICMQGGIHPKLPGHAYFDIAAEGVKRRPFTSTPSARWRSLTVPPDRICRSATG